MLIHINRIQIFDHEFKSRYIPLVCWFEKRFPSPSTKNPYEAKSALLNRCAQLCEGLQNAVSYRAPKNRTYSRTVSLYARVCIVMGVSMTWERKKCTHNL